VVGSGGVRKWDMVEGVWWGSCRGVVVGGVGGRTKYDPLHP